MLLQILYGAVTASGFGQYVIVFHSEHYEKVLELVLRFEIA